MDEYFDDVDKDYDGGGEDDGNDGSCEDDLSDIETDDEITFETDDGSSEFPTATDWMIIGPLSEEIARERQERERLMRKKPGEKS